MEPADSNDIAALLDALDAARAKAIDWIAAHVDSDGRPVGAERFNGYYRLPWALATAGRHDLADRVLGWVQRHALDEHADLKPGAPRQPFIHSIAAYPLPQIAIGAWLLGHHDLARRILAFTREHLFDAHSGGAFSERPEVRRSGRTDLLCTAQLGLAALSVGDDALADACQRWVTALWQQQPETPSRLYPCRIGTTLLREAGPGHTAWDVVTDFHRPHQQFYNPGIAAAFLARYSQGRHDAPALRLARDFLALNIQGAALQFDHRVNAQACKFGWGAAVVLEVEGQGSHLEQVQRMARWFIDSQHADGHWTPSGFLVPQPDDADRLPKTAEHLLHVVTLSRALAGHLAPRPLHCRDA